MRVYMQLPSVEGKPPRFLHLLLQADLLGGWNLVQENGMQGGRGRVKRRHYDNREAAMEALMAGRDSHLQKGYKVVYVEGQRESDG